MHNATGESSDDGGGESIMLLKCIEANVKFSSMTEVNIMNKSFDRQEKE